MGDYDLVATVSYILKATGRSKLSVVGFSQGSTVGFYSFTSNKAFFSDKIKVFIALAPVITMKYSNESFLQTLADSDYLIWTLNDNNYLEIFPRASSST